MTYEDLTPTLEAILLIEQLPSDACELMGAQDHLIVTANMTEQIHMERPSMWDIPVLKINQIRRRLNAKNKKTNVNIIGEVECADCQMPTWTKKHDPDCPQNQL